MRQWMLTILLGAQVLVVALVWGLQTGASDEPEAFLSFAADAVDSITVSDDESSVTLAKADDAWTLADGLPADGGKVDRVLEKLAGAAGGWPVATSESAMARFEVTEDAHQLRVLVEADGDTLADVYLGTSPTFQKVHARHAAGGPAYAIDFSNYEAGTKASDWLRKSLLQPDGALQSVERVGAEGWTLESTDDGWAMADVTVDQDEAAEYTARFTGLSVLGLVDAALPESPAVRLVLTDDAGGHELALFHLEEEDDYVATSNRFAGEFEIPKYVAERLDATAEDFAVDDAAADDGDSETDAAVEEPAAS